MSELTTPADDWELCFLGGAAFAVGGGAGLYFALFQSRTAGALEPFYLTTAGVGAGGNASSFDLSNRDGLNWTRLEVPTPFSITSLHTSAGLMLSASVGIGIGKGGVNYGYTHLSAGRNGVTYFRTGDTGAGAGSGTGVTAFSGIWYSHKLNNNSINPVTAWKKSFGDTIDEIARTFDRGIRDLYRLPY